MGARAQEAVLFHSEQTGELLRLLGILAAGADDQTGVIDPAPTREHLAEWTNVTARTITNRIQRLVEGGELEVLRIGGGPGNPSAYRLTLPIPEVTCLQSPTKGERNGEMGERNGEMGERNGEMGERNDPEMAERVKSLEQRVKEMGEKMDQIFTHLQEMEAEWVKRVKEKGESGQSSNVQTIPYDPNTLNDDDDRAGAEQATIELLDFWQDLTGSFAPVDDDKRARDYLGPLNRLWIKAGHDLEQAKRLLEEKRAELLQDGKTPYRPAAIVPQIFDDLDGVQPRASPNGTHKEDLQPESDPKNWKPVSAHGARR